MSLSTSRIRTLLAVAAFCSAGVSVHAAEVGLARLDCGTEPAPRSVASFSDTLQFPELKLTLTYSCYLVRHGDRYLVWDTGNALDGTPRAPKVSLVEQLARIGVAPDSVEYVWASATTTPTTPASSRPFRRPRCSSARATGSSCARASRQRAWTRGPSRPGALRSHRGLRPAARWSRSPETGATSSATDG